MMTRRAFLKSGGLALFITGFGGGPLFLGRAARAATLNPVNGKPNVLVAIFQRGAMDGLMAVTPFTDPHLATLRPRLALMPTQASGGLIDLDGRFGLHPGFGPLASLFTEKKLAIVHGVGSPDPTRSHFDAQDYMETGTPGRKGTSSGWLNRASGLLGHDASPFQAVSLTPALPRSLYGEEPALAIGNLNDFGIRVPGRKRESEEAGAGFEALYEDATESLLRDTGREGFEAAKLLSSVHLASYMPEEGVTYPQTPFGTSMKQIAQLIKANVGLEIAFAEMGGWDTHVLEGAAKGTFALRAQELAGALKSFWTDIGDWQDRVVVLTMTEFGRTAHENGSGGTDHGRASCLFVLGSAVDGGKVHGVVRSLAPEELDEGRDLPVTTDFRSVFSEVAGKHLGIGPDEVLFPGWTGERVTLMRNT